MTESERVARLQQRIGDRGCVVFHGRTGAVDIVWKDESIDSWSSLQLAESSPKTNRCRVCERGDVHLAAL
jgi:hypothetical protein